MPYQHIEQITERKGEKIALFLTAENAAGLMLATLPVYLVTGGLPFWLRAVALGLAALLGVVATLDIGGLALYERVVWRARGLIRQRVSGRTVRPEQLAGATPATRRERALRAGGPIQIVRRAGRGEQRRPALASPARAAVPVRPALTPPTEGARDADRPTGQLPD